jgi:IS30 family transposase
VSTVSREVDANGGPRLYRAWAAHQAAFAASRRPQPTKLASHPPLRDRVAELLCEWWSPRQISARLRLDYPDDPMMRVSHETIYQTLYVQGRGELRRELAVHLRRGRDQRRAQGKGRLEMRGQIQDMVNISDRPAEADDRAVPGHWEGDLIMGKGNRSAVGTLVERMTRFVLLLHLGAGFNPPQVRDAMIEAILSLPELLRRTVTWDQGREMRRHLDFTVATGVTVYFCDPHTPWQRGSNENTNGLLRQYMPKGTDLFKHSKSDLAEFAHSLNGRPRETLGWMTPSEKLAEVLASTV